MKKGLNPPQNPQTENLDDLSVYFLALQENYAAPPLFPSDDSCDVHVPSEETANPQIPADADANKPPLSTAAESKQEMADELSAEEQIARAKLEAIKEKIMNTNFLTISGSLTGLHGCRKITKPNGDEHWIGQYADLMLTELKRELGQSSFMEAHEKVKQLAKDATNPKRSNNFFSINIARTNEATNFYNDVANDKIQPKSVVVHRC